jgi:glyoxylase-like metal-dependent hydrolase (beta-lactamase superfamily II)
MKRLHRKDLYCWSSFAEKIDADFNSFLWTRPEGNVAIDPLPLGAHDREHLRKLGGLAWVVFTNSDHVRGGGALAEFAPRLAGPIAEQATFPLRCDRWLSDGEELVPGLRVRELHGSKTPGELALILEGTTLIAGDLLRAHRAERLMTLLPAQGLKDPARVAESVRALAASEPPIEDILVGDGWCLFGQGRKRLLELLEARG